jgi:hypothetical protein
MAPSSRVAEEADPEGPVAKRGVREQLADPLLKRRRG